MNALKGELNMKTQTTTKAARRLAGAGALSLVLLAVLVAAPSAVAEADPGLSCRPMCLPEPPALASSPTASMTPEIRPLALSQVAVDGLRDTLTFAAGGSILSVGTTILLSAPDGSSMAFVLTSYINDDASPQVWRLDGTQVSGDDHWESMGSLANVPADGTWQWSILSGFYNSGDDNYDLDPSAFPDVTLSVAGKTARAHFASIFPVDNSPQLWNWHLTPAGGTFQDSRGELGAVVDAVSALVGPLVSTHPRPGPLADPDTVVDPQEDPANARYFKDTPTPPSLPSVRTAANPDGSTTAYLDQDDDGEKDRDEPGVTIPVLPVGGGEGGGGGNEGPMEGCPGWLTGPPSVAAIRSGVDGCDQSGPHPPYLV